jgi:hypothetical protein
MADGEKRLPYIPGKTLDEVREWVKQVLSGKSGSRRPVKVRDLQNKKKHK